jgi:peptidoglycan/LPS O-acetylase OafA/YrhL
MNNNRLKSLDGWRGISVLLVICCHLSGARYGYLLDTGTVSVQAMLHMGFDGIVMLIKVLCGELLGYFGALGVRIFFILSGFIITHLLLKEEARYGSISILDFFKRRVFRILPALYTFLIAMTCVNAVGFIAVDNNSLQHSALFLCSLAKFECNWPIGHTWSLAVEEQFYLLWPFLFLLAPKRYRIVIAIAALLFGIVLSRIPAFQMPFFNVPMSFACISTGVCIALSAAIRDFIGRLNMLVYLICVAGALFQPLINFAAPNLVAVVEVLFPFFIGVVVFKPLFSEGWLRKVLEQKILSTIGVFSYSIYIWQQPFTGFPDKYLSNSPLAYPLLMIVPVLFSYYLIEQPFIRMGKKISFRKKTIESAT